MMNESMAFDKTVSVIVPVYNVKDYLSDCLESVIKQTFKNLEIIVVDDGSTDGSDRICDDYKKKDSRIKVIHQENRGLSAARNEGVKASSGDYVVFLDSDDYMHPDCINVLLGTAEERRVEFVRCGYLTTSAGLNDQKWEKTEKKVTIKNVMPWKEGEKILWETEKGYVWRSIISNRIVKEISFLEGRNWEDIPYIFEVLSRVKELCKIDEEYWAYRIRQDSITHEAFSKKRLDVPYMTWQRDSIIEKCFPQLSKLAGVLFWIRVMELYNRAYFDKNKMFLGLLFSDVKKIYLKDHYSVSYVFADGVSFSNRVAVLTCRVSFRGTCFVKRVLYKFKSKRGKR